MLNWPSALRSALPFIQHSAFKLQHFFRVSVPVVDDGDEGKA
jgi:hypothetical protein